PTSLFGLAACVQIDIDGTSCASDRKRLLEMIQAQLACLALRIMLREIALHLRQRDGIRLDARRLQDGLKRKNQSGENDDGQRNGKGNEDPDMYSQQQSLCHWASVTF